MKTKSTKRALLASLLSLVICISMLVGTTFAWFTDSVTSANNIIQSGNLDVTLEWMDGKDAPAGPDDAAWKDASTDAIFDHNLWEPGYTTVRHIKIGNEGSLALKYKVVIEANGTVSDLTDVIDVYYFDPAQQIADRTKLAGVTPMGTLTSVLGNMSTTAQGELAANTDDVITIALKMKETAGNEYMNKSVGDSFVVKVFATQLAAESDSFDNQYDVEAGYTVEVKNADELKKALEKGNNVVLTEDIELTGNLMATKDAVIDLNGKTIKTNASTSLFQSQSNAAPDMIITSSTAGAVIDATNSTFNNGVVHSYGKTVISNVTINAGSNKVVQVQGNGSVEIYDTVINADSGNTFDVAGDFTLGEGTVVNVTNLNSNLINNNGAHEIVIDGAKINIGTFKVNGNSVISLNNASTLEMKNTTMKIDNFVLSPFGGDSLVSKVNGITIENCTFDVTDSNGASCTFVAKDGKYRLVQK